MAAGAIATAVQAKRLLLLTDVAGVLDEQKLIEELSIGEVPRLIERGHDHRRHDPQGRKLRRCGRGRGRGRRHRRWPGAALRADRVADAAWRRHADFAGPAHDAGASIHVETWIFDLDNTLYPASCRLFDQIDVRMGSSSPSCWASIGLRRSASRRTFSIAWHDAARADARAWRGAGRLSRLCARHRSFTHSGRWPPWPGPETLPGRKLIFTNGTVAHAEKVLARLGVREHFTGIFDIVHSDFIPKPQLEPYEKFVAVQRSSRSGRRCSRTLRAISRCRTGSA